jgi:uncharacterized low-complexity protein
MSKKNSIKPVALTVGAAFAGSLAGQAVADTEANPFAMSDLAEGYMVADSQGAEGRCGEGKCGEGMQKPKEAEGQCGAKPKAEEGKCGGKPKAEEEGKCGGNK